MSKTNTGNGKRAPAETSRYILGRSKIFTPEVINDIHIKSELGRYRMRGFSLFKKIPHWDDLTFLPGTPGPYGPKRRRREACLAHERRQS